MAPGVFKDLGKQLTDLLGKEFDVGEKKLEVKTSAPNGVSFTANSAMKDSIASSLETKFKYGSGISFTGKLNEKAVMEGGLELDSTVMKALKLNFDCTTLDQNSKGDAVFKKAKGALEYKQDLFTTQMSYDAMSGIADGTLVVGQNGFALGGQVEYDTDKSLVTKYAAAGTYKTSDYAVSAIMRETGKKTGVQYVGSYYHKINSGLQVGGQVVQSLGTNSTEVTVGALQKLDKETTVKGKLNSSGSLSLSVKQALSPKLSMTLAAQVNALKLESNDHKLGLNLNFSA